MKKAFIILCIAAVMSSCGGKSSDDQNNGGADSTMAANQTAKQHNSDADTNAMKTGTESTGTPGGNEPGAKLIAASDCLTCHKEDVKLIGPAYQDVAAKYPNNQASVDMLTEKVIKGGKGNWGEIPMSAHPQLAVKDVNVMIKYILSLKK